MHRTMDRPIKRALVALLLIFLSSPLYAQGPPQITEARVETAIAKVKPSLVRIHVVSSYYSEGRQQKAESSGSGVIITEEGHVITNHHVAGHAARLFCTFASGEDMEAELIGVDPMTDIAIIKLKPREPRKFNPVKFGDSSKLNVGDPVLAMGSPMALSPSVTLGIVSNMKMMMPRMMGGGRIRMDGENVGSLVQWIGHDAAIYGGNSGGPLVNLEGEIIGINEISMGLGGAIPGNLANSVAKELIANGTVKRSWVGIEVQPRLKHSDVDRGILLSGAFPGSPAAEAGLQSGDILIRLGGHDVNARYAEELPRFAQFVADLPIGEEVEAIVLRDGEEKSLTIRTIERERVNPEQTELKQWGITVRDLSLVRAKELGREDRDGVLVTSLRPGGPVGEAKPQIRRNDVIVEIAGIEIKSVQDLIEATERITEGKTEPTAVLAAFERKTAQHVTVVKVGIKDLKDPSLEVKKAWLPITTQVISRDIAEELGDSNLKGFRITRVYEGTSAESAGLEVGDFIVAIDGEKLTASSPEDYEELPTLIRQYRAGTTAELTVLRGEEQMKIPVELIRAPKAGREMKKYRNDDFEFTVRDVTFFDRADGQWKAKERGVVVDDVVNGGWAALGQLYPGDLIVEVDGRSVKDVDAMKTIMEEVNKARPKSIVMRIERKIHSRFIEIEPNWEEQE